VVKNNVVMNNAANHLIGFTATAAKAAIITGDPDRVEVIADLLGTTTSRGSRRGFTWRVLEELDLPLMVCSTGIGSPSAAIVVEELADIGIRAIVRIGTCGAVSDQVAPAELVVSTGCVRHEGTTSQYIEPAYPAVPGGLVLSAMVVKAPELDVPVHFGITHCKDSYYSEQPDRNVDRDGLESQWAVLRRAGVLATEMEAAALFVVGGLRGLQCGAVLIPADPETDPAALRRALASAVELGLHALRAAR
jgi:uridine phosphorylase